MKSQKSAQNTGKPAWQRPTRDTAKPSQSYNSKDCSPMYKTPKMMASSNGLSHKQTSCTTKDETPHSKSPSAFNSSKYTPHSQRQSMSATRNNQERISKGRSASQDIFFKPHQMHNFWSQMGSMEKINKWNSGFGQTCDKNSGNNRSRSSCFGDTKSEKASPARQMDGQSYGIWGQSTARNINFKQRNASPAFGGAQIADNKSDFDNTSVISEGSTNMNQFKSRQAFMSKKQVARCTYSQIQLGADESQVTNQFNSHQKVSSNFEDLKTQITMDQSKKQKILSSNSGSFTSPQKGPNLHNKLTGKVYTRLRTFTSQISNLPGPKTGIVSSLPEDVGKERRDNLVFNDEKFRLRHDYYLSSYYQDAKYKSDYKPGKEYESYKKDLSDKNECRKTTPIAFERRKQTYHAHTKLY